jgi:hypothetical protein
MSVLSKRNIILPYDPLYENEDDIKKYLEYVKSGGNLIVMNSDTDFKGSFSKLFSVKVGNKSNFDSVQSHNKANFNQLLNISGAARNIDFKSPDITILSSYMDKNQTIAPFAVEKTLGKGRIVLVNSYGFFGSVFDSPDKYFPSLAHIYELIDLRLDANNKNLSSNVQSDPAAPAMRFIGNSTMSGQATIQGSSLLLEDNTLPSHNFYVEKIYVSSKVNNASKYSMKSIGSDTNNMLVKDLKLSGRYDAIINFTGDFHIPYYFPSSSSLSYYDYIPIFVPTGFDLVIRLSDTAEFAIGNSSNPILITDNQIIFHGVRPEVNFTRPVPALVKNPEVTLSGKVTFGELVTEPNFRGDRLIVEGNTSMQLDHADLYHDRYSNRESEEQHGSVTYLKWAHFDDDAVTRASNEILQIPGDVSDLSKQQGVRVPWIEALVSPISLISLACIVTLSALAIRYLKPKIENREIS